METRFSFPSTDEIGPLENIGESIAEENDVTYMSGRFASVESTFLQTVSACTVWRTLPIASLPFLCTSTVPPIRPVIFSIREQVFRVFYQKYDNFRSAPCQSGHFLVAVR